MPYNTEVADRVRASLADREVREVKMFGGLAFMMNERMLVCVSAGGSDLLVRVAPESDAQHLQRPGARRAEMGEGRSMGAGWITVDAEALSAPEDFLYWMQAAAAFHARGSVMRRTSKTKSTAS